MNFHDWMDDFDFEVPSDLFGPSNLERCNAMFTEAERHGIEDAAMLAHGGHDDDAEAARVRAGYGGLR